MGNVNGQAEINVHKYHGITFDKIFWWVTTF